METQEMQQKKTATKRAGKLEDSFDDAIKRVSAQEQNQEIPENLQEAFHGKVPSQEKLVELSREYYRKHQSTIDLAIEGALKVLDDPELEHQIRHQQDTFTPGGKPSENTINLATQVLESQELQKARNEAASSGLFGLGFGFSAGASLLLGLGAGGDVLWAPETNNCYLRGWGIFSLGLDASISAGLNIGIWEKLPEVDQSNTTGWVVDLFPMPMGYPVGIRFMTVMEKVDGEYQVSGYTIELGAGIGGGFAYYWGIQYVWPIPSKRMKLKVKNVAMNPSTTYVVQNEVAEIQGTLTNTSGVGIIIHPNDEMTIRMPSYYSNSEVADMAVNLPGWSAATADKQTLTITYQGSSNYTWPAGSNLVFNVTNVCTDSCSSKPKGSNVTVRIPQAVVPAAVVDRPGAVGSSALTLQPLTISGTADWNMSIDSSVFQMVQFAPTSGTGVPLTLMESADDFRSVSSVMTKGSTTEYWYLGYQFYTNDSGKVIFNAAWYYAGDTPDPSYLGSKISLNSLRTTSTAYYEDDKRSDNFISMDVDITCS